MFENDITKIIVDAAIEVHRTLGPGLLESVYEETLFYELQIGRGLQVVRQQTMPVVYKEVKLNLGFRSDLVVEDKIIVELKSIETVLDVHKKTLLTYLRLTDRRVGLLINFNSNLLKDGITRIVNGL